MRSARAILAAWVIAITLALLVRLPGLERRPMHVDEAVHALKFQELWERGRYVYDPDEYHGPTLYYATLPLAWLSGAASFADTTERLYRLTPALFGAGIVALLWLLRDGLGRAPVVYAALLTALAPLPAYYSRYYIQETLLVFFTVLALAAGWRYVRAAGLGTTDRGRPRLHEEPNRAASCAEARRTRRSDATGPRAPTAALAWAALTALAVGLMHATKETFVITLGAWGLALGVNRVWLRRPASRRAASGQRSRRATLGEHSGPEVAGARHVWRPYLRPAPLLLGAAIAGLTSFTLYSAFFTNPVGPLDSIRTYATYLDRASGHGLHNHPWDYYLRLLAYTHYPPAPVWTHGLILVLALLGAAAALRGRGVGDGYLPLLRFLAVSTLLLGVSYSAIPYKTPWSILTFVQCAILLAGVGADVLLRAARNPWARGAVAAVLLAGCGHLLAQTAWANGRYAADNRNPLAYAHATSGVVRLGKWAEKLARVHPDGHAMLIKVMTPDYWPLPWYLRRFSRVGYWDAPPEDADAALIITKPELIDEVRRGCAGDYVFSHYGVRPSVTLVAGVRRDLFEAFQATQPKPEGYLADSQPARTTPPPASASAPAPEEAP